MKGLKSEATGKEIQSGRFQESRRKTTVTDVKVTSEGKAQLKTPENSAGSEGDGDGDVSRATGSTGLGGIGKRRR